MPKPKKIIAIEEHFVVPGMPMSSSGPNPGLIEDVGALRLENMDKAGVDMQILSHTSPGIQAIVDAKEATKKAAETNDFLAKLVQKHPTRYAGFATIAVQDPKAAADELERSVRQLGMLGVVINGHTNGEYLDAEKFFPVWERASDLDVPIYLHPAHSVPPWTVFDDYPVLRAGAFGWAAETGGHALRLVLSGLFERFPKGKLILGHMGESIPFFLSRIDTRWKGSRVKKPLPKLPSEYIKKHFMITTSGMFAAPPLICTIDMMGVDCLMFSIDYPYEDIEEGVQFLCDAPIDEASREKIAHGTAEKYLRLKV